MNCDTIRDDILLYAAGASDSDTRTRVVRHLATGCPRCAGSLSEAEALLAHVGVAVAPVAPPPQLKQRILDRIRQESRGSSRNVVPLRSPRAVARWIPVAAAAAITGGAILIPMRMQQRQLEAQVSRQADEIGRLEAQTDQARRAERLLASNQVQIVPLAGTEVQPNAAARIAWDLETNRWHLFVTAMQPLPEGQVYELWFVTADQRKVAAGLFSPDTTGKATLEVAIPEGLGTIALAAITNEPAGGSEQPTGQIQAAGSVAAIGQT
jgi:anti-sigma-K factor RskA